MSDNTTNIALTFRLGKPEELPSVDDAVAMHQSIAEEQGMVALGKTGKALAAPTIERALDSEQPAIVLLTRSKDGFHGYRAELKDILSHPCKPREDQVPRYYRHLMMDIRSWLIIGPLVPVAAEELDRYCLCSNKRPLLEVLRSTRTANMLVYKGALDSVRARMRNIVRRLLKKYKYPPDKDGTHDASIDLVLTQAEKLADVWSAPA